LCAFYAKGNLWAKLTDFKHVLLWVSCGILHQLVELLSTKELKEGYLRFKNFLQILKLVEFVVKHFNKSNIFTNNF